MKTVVDLIIAALVLIISSIWAFTSGANYQLRGLTPSQRMSELDTTMIGEKWMLISAGLMALAMGLIIFAVLLYFRGRRRFA